MRLFSALVLIITVIGVSSCRKELDITKDPSARLEFSTDTVLFDTVFTTLGSTTQRLKVYNRNKNAVSISSVRIGGGSGSSYRMNVDGLPGNELHDIEIAGNDSIFVFVEVTIDPNASAIPFIVADSLLFDLNGNRQQVQLAAYGQNAHFYNDSVISGNVTWSNDLPHVVFNNLIVDSGSTLTIMPGTKIYMYKSSFFAVLGTLKSNGTLTDSITIQGTRLEPIYYDEPGQWNGMWFFRGSTNNEIRYTTIKNAIQGIRVDSLPESANPNLVLANSIVKNMQVVGLVAYNAQIEAFNNLFFNCGQYAIIGMYGGKYTFLHNTIGNYNFMFNRQTPSVAFTDYIEIFTNPLEVHLVNNIIWGSLNDEFLLDLKAKPNDIVEFEYNLVRSSNTSFSATNIRNRDPKFSKAEKEDYHLKDQSSPAYGKGIYLNSFPGLSTDMDGKPRQNPPSVGCYEAL